MKFLPATIAEIVRQTQPQQRNVRLLIKFVVALAGLVALFSVLFHFIMAYEGRSHHPLDGVYWTFTVMTTLGFGDITFTSVIGRMFSVVVMLSGLVFLLMLLPFTFIEFFYAPWMAAQAAARTPKKAPANLRGHVIFTTYEPITAAVIPRLEQYQRPYLVLVPDQESATRLLDLGVKVMLGYPDKPETWQLARIGDAALVIATDTDVANTNAVFTARQESSTTPIVATAKELPSTEILPMAGATSILRLDEMLGDFLARCVGTGSSRIHQVGEFGPLIIAETTAAAAGIVGRTVRTSGLRETTGLTLIGVWHRGAYHAATPDLTLTEGMMLIVAGTRGQVADFDRARTAAPLPAGPVVIVGAGRVGRATARHLGPMGFEYRFVEKIAGRSPVPDRTVVGDAADMPTIREAGLLRARTIVLTSHDDDANIYLTVFCRRVRPDIQIIARATHARNVATLHRAGADFVMSYPTLAANALCSTLLGGDLLMVAEGVHAFRVKVPPKLRGVCLADSRIREDTGCLVVAVQNGDSTLINPPATHVFELAHELILVGSIEAEERFLEEHPGARIGARGASVLSTGAATG